MKTSQNGLAFLSKEEGFKLEAYQDTRGIWTIGVGHTAAAGDPKPVKGMKITTPQVLEILSRDVKDVENEINKAVVVQVNQNEYDALVSLVFNIGTAAFKSSTVLRKLNANDREGAADAFLMWKKAGNDPDRLLPRRQRERTLFLTKVNKDATDNLSTVSHPIGVDQSPAQREPEGRDGSEATGSREPDASKSDGSEQSGSQQSIALRLGLAALRGLGVWLRSGVVASSTSLPPRNG